MTWCDFQVQYGYVVVQMLMEHLDHNSHESAKIKASVVGVLSEIVDISAVGRARIAQSLDDSSERGDRSSQPPYQSQCLVWSCVRQASLSLSAGNAPW